MDSLCSLLSLSTLSLSLYMYVSIICIITHHFQILIPSIGNRKCMKTPFQFSSLNQFLPSNLIIPFSFLRETSFFSFLSSSSMWVVLALATFMLCFIKIPFLETFLQLIFLPHLKNTRRRERTSPRQTKCLMGWWKPSFSPNGKICEYCFWDVFLFPLSLCICVRVFWSDFFRLIFHIFFSRGKYSKSDIKLTRTRIEIIKKKRNATQKYLRNDVADLLRNGLDVNAFGRVISLSLHLCVCVCARVICHEFSFCFFNQISQAFPKICC